MSLPVFKWRDMVGKKWDEFIPDQEKNVKILGLNYAINDLKEWVWEDEIGPSPKEISDFLLAIRIDAAKVAIEEMKRIRVLYKVNELVFWPGEGDWPEINIDIAGEMDDFIEHCVDDYGDGCLDAYCAELRSWADRIEKKRKQLVESGKRKPKED